VFHSGACRDVFPAASPLLRLDDLRSFSAECPFFFLANTQMSLLFLDPFPFSYFFPPFLFFTADRPRVASSLLICVCATPIFFFGQSNLPVSLFRHRLLWLPLDVGFLCSPSPSDLKRALANPLLPFFHMSQFPAVRPCFPPLAKIAFLHLREIPFRVTNCSLEKMRSPPFPPLLTVKNSL